MLGDCGANALGAALGVAMVRSLPWPARLAAAASAVGLILASEKVSFSRVIATNPTLNRLDWLGRAAGPDAASRRAAPSRRATGAQPRDGRPVRSGGGLSTQPTRPRREPRR
jgi:hypothetical protein